MTEKEKMITGEMYNPMDTQLVSERHHARILCNKINKMPEDVKNERDKLLYELLKNSGENLYIEPPFYCDYGYNIKLGHAIFMNFNCCILDVAEVNIGNNTMLGPNVQIYTATHPLEAKARNSGKEYAKPINIGNITNI